MDNVSTPLSFTWVDQAEHLSRILDQLQQQTIIAVDTESDSLYSYFEKVCLIQISTVDQHYIIDPLALDATPLGKIFSNPTIRKVLHASEYDVITLRRDFGFQFENLFDTMLAARILGWEKCGLGNILMTYFKVSPDKRFQQYNWGTRPLSPDALDYATLDTQYLIDLYHLQQKLLRQNKQVEEAEDAFVRIAQSRVAIKYFDPAASWNVKGSKDLPRSKQGMLQALFVFRDYAARQMDLPPFKTMGDATLVRLANHPPHSMRGLKKMKGFNRAFVRKFGDGLLQILQAKPPKPAPPSPSKRPPSEAITKRYERLRDWRNEIAKKRKVEADVILSNKTLMHIARNNPANLDALAAANLLGNWQLNTYAKAILSVLKTS
ncbi:MAG: ribonuclease D [Chloroflexota bacterium]